MSALGILVVVVLSLASASGCARRVEAEFPRPPVTATLPPVEENEPQPVAEIEPVLEEPEPEEDEAVVPEVAVVESKLDEKPPRPAPPAPEPVSPPPASTELAGVEELDPELQSKLDRAGNLLGSFAGRSLSDQQRSQVTAARGFVAQARRALNEGDERRALVLVDKGLILAEDVERASRR